MSDSHQFVPTLKVFLLFSGEMSLKLEMRTSDRKQWTASIRLSMFTLYTPMLLDLKVKKSKKLFFMSVVVVS